MRSFFLALILSALSGSYAQSAERYFVTFYASQDSRASPPASHTLACFVKASFDDEAHPQRLSAVESVTISWLPAAGVIRLLAGPEPGRNLTLQESLAWANERGLATTSWGPYEIRKETFDAAVAQVARLQSGAIAFKALDSRYRPDTASNCIHAVSDIVRGPLLNSGTNRGNSATQMVVHHFRGLMIDAEQTHPWITPYVGRTEVIDAKEAASAP